MKKLALFSIILLALAMFMSSCGESERIEYIKSQSAVLSYVKEEGNVEVRTLLTLKNYAKRDIEFTV